VRGKIEDAAYLSNKRTRHWGLMSCMIGVYALNRGTGERVPADFYFFRIEVRGGSNFY
jgi:hypothetical protein